MPAATGRTVRREIVQCARTIGPGYGVSGPAWQLERAFRALDCTCGRFTLDNLGVRTDAMPAGGPITSLVRFWRDVVLFSAVGSIVLWWKFGGRRRGRPVVICQVDALYGDLFVVRSLHKAFLERHPLRRWMLLRNPLHAFVLARDHMRFRWNVHRHVVALSQRNKEEIIRLYGVRDDRITVIPNGVDLERFRPSPESRCSVRRTLSLRDDELVAIFVGHEFERKGLRVVLEALRLLAGRSVRLPLIVAGRGAPDALKIEFSDLGGAVRYLGHRDDIERFYAAADVFVLPAAFDISPLVGLEALAAGLPVLMTDVGGVGDYLRHDENGWFITRDPADVAAKLRRLVEDRDLLRRMSAHARASVADLDWRTIAGRYLELIDRLLPLPGTGDAGGGPSRRHPSAPDRHGPTGRRAADGGLGEFDGTTSSNPVRTVT
jgi:UDP-glucose:(heptosyl)LPS alpha-1,3-glucosyltransferase